MPSSKKRRMFITKEDLNKIEAEKKPSKSPLTKERLIKRLAVKYDLPKKNVENLIKDFFIIVSNNSKLYSHVSLYGLGTFREKRIKEKYVKVLGKNEFTKTKEKKYLVFKSSFEI